MTTPQGPDFLRARGPMILGWITLVILVGGFGLWSMTTSLSGAVIAPGQVAVEQYRQIVQHPDGGVVAEILVEEGDIVQAGDVLLRLDGTLLQAELDIVEGQLSEMRARRARLEAERDDADRIIFPDDLQALAASRPSVAEQLDGQERLFAARNETVARTLERLEQRKQQTRSQIEGIEAQSAALGTQLDLIQRELVDQQALLDLGLSQVGRVLGLQREQARLSGQVGELRAALAQAEGAITELDLQMLGLTAQRREEANTQLRDAGATELQLFQRQRALAEQVARLDIRAPATGAVLGMQVTTPRAVIRPAEPLAYIIPQDRPLIITVQVSPLNINEVTVGQPARLMFPAFSMRTTPELDGTVAMVSADALTDQATGLSFYRAEVTLSPEELERLGQTLLPGMPVEAFLQTSARSPMSYLLKPFTDYFTHAFRES